MEYLKTGRALFSTKIYFWPNLSKKNPNWAQNLFSFFGFFEKFIKNVFLGSNLKWELVDISPPIPYLEKFWFSIYKPKCWQTIFRKASGMIFLIFCLQINTKVFYKLIVSLQMCIARNVQSTQKQVCNKKVTKRKKWRMKLIFCLKINVKCILKLLSNTVILGVCGQACLNYPK